ncbi:MAG: hypothetical protein FJY85_01060 [Deltaproteobacteria bacterium]|nr:hypothetical protein [Deltaproteobacteria bacterium]
MATVYRSRSAAYYRRFIENLKARVTAARISAARHVNRDMILLYWDIGRAIVEKQKTHKWGDSVVEMTTAAPVCRNPQMGNHARRLIHESVVHHSDR